MSDPGPWIGDDTDEDDLIERRVLRDTASSFGLSAELARGDEAAERAVRGSHRYQSSLLAVRLAEFRRSVIDALPRWLRQRLVPDSPDQQQH